MQYLGINWGTRRAGWCVIRPAVRRVELDPTKPRALSRRDTARV